MCGAGSSEELDEDVCLSRQHGTSRKRGRLEQVVGGWGFVSDGLAQMAIYHLLVLVLAVVLTTIIVTSTP